MKKELCKVFETEYAKKYNLYLERYYGDNHSKYTVDQKDLQKQRPIYIFEKGELFSVCFAITTKCKNNSTSVKWPKDGTWDDKDRWIMFQPLIIPNTSIWNWNQNVIPEHIVKRHHSSLIKMSNRKDISKNYAKQLSDAIYLIK